MTINIAVVGLGEIALSQHIPIIERSPLFKLVATVSRSKNYKSLSNFGSLDELVFSGINVDAVALCIPPEPRFNIALQAFELGFSVLLEKPVATSIAQAEILEKKAAEHGVVVFSAWHSQYSPYINDVRNWVLQNGPSSFEINWHENVRKWHPDQKWISCSGGFGVFDPGINALSILTEIMPYNYQPKRVSFTKPANWMTPIAASFDLESVEGVTGVVSLDWRHVGDELWDIQIKSKRGELKLSKGGQVLFINGELMPEKSGWVSEYDSLYKKFYKLIKSNTSSITKDPLVIVADLFLNACTKRTGEFHV